MTYEEYEMMNTLSTTEWTLVMAELDEEQRRDYYWHVMVNDDKQAALNA